MTNAADGPAGADPTDDTADDVAQNLVRLLRVATRMRQHGDMGIAYVLALLLERGPQRVGEIAHALGTDPSTVSRKVTALVEAGLVERRPDPADGRAHLLAATEAGTRHCADGRRKRVQMIAAVLAPWPDDSRRQLATLLGRFADDMQEHDRRASARRPGGES